MATKITVWHGTDEDLKALMSAVASNCQCADEAQPTCEAHLMLTDQKVLDHLAFVARRRQDFCHGEFDESAEWW